MSDWRSERVGGNPYPDALRRQPPPSRVRAGDDADIRRKYFLTSTQLDALTRAHREALGRIEELEAELAAEKRKRTGKTRRAVRVLIGERDAND